MEAGGDNGHAGDVVLAAIIEIAGRLGDCDWRAAFREGYGIATVGIGPSRRRVEIDNGNVHFGDHRRICDGFEIAVHHVAAAADD